MEHATTDKRPRSELPINSDADVALLSHLIRTQTEIINGAMDSAALMQRIVDLARELSNATGAAVELIEGDELVFHCGSGNMASQVGTRLKVAGSLFSYCDASGAPLSCRDSETDPRVNRDICRRLHMRSMIIVPLMTSGRVVGILNVNWNRPNAFADRTVWALRVISGLLATAMVHAEEVGQRKRLLAEKTSALTALQISEDRFRQAFEASPIGMAIVEFNGVWTRVNRALCTMLGYTEAELQKIRVQSLTHPDDLQSSADHREQLVSGAINNYRLEKRYIHRSGRIVWVQLNVSLARDADGAPLHFIAQIEDITHRRQVQDALRDSELAYRTMFELAGVGIAHIDATTQRFVRVNPKLCEITGYSAEELAGFTTRELTHLDDLGEHDGRFRQLQEGPSAKLSYEKRYIHKSGAVIWLAINSTTFSGNDGAHRHLIAMFRDITEQRRAEETLRSQERQYRTLTNQVPVAIFQNDPAGNNLFVNARWCSITGLSAEQAHGPGWLAAIHPDDRAQLIEKRAAAFAAGTEWAMEHRYINTRGQIVWVQGGAAPLLDDAGRVIGFLGSAIDITERKRAEWLENDRRDVLERVARQSPLGDVLDRLVLLIERQAEHCTGAIVVIKDGNVELRSPNLAGNIVEALTLKALSITAGVIAAAYERTSGLAVSDIATEPAWANVRQTLLDAGFNMCWMLPIISSESPPLGVLTIFCSCRRKPSAVETEMLMTAGRLATVAIEHHRANELLAHLVRHDRLTGLPNRMLLDDRVEHALATARRSGKAVAMMVLDIDKFKSVNDTLGHHTGDQVLQAFATRFREQLRASDTIARLGGDEFVIVLPELTEPGDATMIAQKLIDCLLKPLELPQRSLRVTVSIGIAIFPDDAMDAAGLQLRADGALYDVKARGRNGFSLCATADSTT